jgi:hypothetical protein
MVSSVQIVVQCALSVAVKQCCHLDFMKKELVWLIAGHLNTVSEHGVLSAFSGLCPENWDGWSP